MPEDGRCLMRIGNFPALLLCGWRKRKSKKIQKKQKLKFSEIFFVKIGSDFLKFEIIRENLHTDSWSVSQIANSIISSFSTSSVWKSSSISSIASSLGLVSGVHHQIIHIDHNMKYEDFVPLEPAVVGNLGVVFRPGSQALYPRFRSTFGAGFRPS